MSVLRRLLSLPRRSWNTFALLLTICVAMLLLVGGRPTPSPVLAASDDDPTPVGFIDQASARYLTVQLNAQEHDYGRFTVGLPGVGYLVSAGVAQATVLSPTAVHLQYSGNGWLDAGAQLDPLYGDC